MQLVKFLSTSAREPLTQAVKYCSADAWRRLLISMGLITVPSYSEKPT